MPLTVPHMSICSHKHSCREVWPDGSRRINTHRVNYLQNMQRRLGAHKRNTDLSRDDKHYHMILSLRCVLTLHQSQTNKVLHAVNFILTVIISSSLSEWENCIKYFACFTVQKNGTIAQFPLCCHQGGIKLWTTLAAVCCVAALDLGKAPNLNYKEKTMSLLYFLLSFCSFLISNFPV